MLFMLFICSRINKNIIYKNYHKAIYKLSKNSIHKIHEHCKSIGYLIKIITK